MSLESEARRSLWPVLGLIGGLFLAFHPLWKSGFRLSPGDLGDARLVHFSLEHSYLFLARDLGHLDLWDPPIFFPARNVAAYTDTMLSQVPFYAPWQWFGAAPDTAFQLWFLTIASLNFLAALIFLQRLFGLGDVAATAGAFLFAFGSSRMAHIGHPQLIPGFYVLTALFAVVRVFQPAHTPAARRTRRWWIVGFFGALLLQAYTAFYPLFFLVFFLALVGVVALCFKSSRQRCLHLLREEAPVLLATALLAGLLLSPLVQRYLLTSDMLGMRTWRGHVNYIPRWWSWFLMGIDSWLYGELQSSRLLISKGAFFRGSAHSNGLGFVTLVLVVLGLYGERRHSVVRWVVLASVLGILATTMWPGGSGITLWRVFYEWMPGAAAIRVVGRIGMFLLIPGALGLAFFCQVQLEKKRWGIVAVLMLLVVAEQVHDPVHFDKEVARWRVAKVVEQVDANCRAFFISTMAKRPQPRIHEDAMWAALETGVPTLNGRYGNWPPEWKLFQVNRREGDWRRQRQIRSSFDRWVDYNCLEPAEICWVEMNLPRRDVARRIQLSDRKPDAAQGCSGP